MNLFGQRRTSSGAALAFQPAQWYKYQELCCCGLYTNSDASTVRQVTPASASAKQTEFADKRVKSGDSVLLNMWSATNQTAARAAYGRSDLGSALRSADVDHRCRAGRRSRADTAAVPRPRPRRRCTTYCTSPLQPTHRGQWRSHASTDQRMCDVILTTGCDGMWRRRDGGIVKHDWWILGSLECCLTNVVCESWKALLA